MAFTGQDDALLDPNKQNQQQGAGQTPGQTQGAPMTTGSGQDPFAGAGNVSTAGVGAGGTGGWTNIQAYLNANQGNTGSSDALSKQVGSAFDQADQQFKDQSGQAKQQAQSEMDRSNMGQDQASKLINDASNVYQYGNNQQSASKGPDPYQAILDQFKTARQAYSGPSSFTFAPEGYSQVQDYGSNLGNDQGFGALMQGVYNKAAGGQLNSGQQALQTQLDTNNPLLQQARQNLLDRYSGLSQGIQQGTTDTDQFVKNAASTVGQNQSALDQYLTQTGTQDKNQVDQSRDALNQQLKGLADSLSQNVNLKWGTTNVDPFNPQNTTFGWGTQHGFSAAPSATANETNIGGVDQQRNGWNVIQDILGRPEQKINRDTPFDPSQVNLNWQNPAIAGSGVISLNDLTSNPNYNGMYNQGILDALTGGSLVKPSGGRQV